MAHRVLQVITPSHMSGAETQVVRVAKRMRERGHQMPVLLKRHPGVRDEMRSRGIEVDTASIGGKANLFALAAIARVVRRHQATLTHSSLSTASWWCGWLEALGGPRSIGHVHGFTSAAWHRRQRHLIAVSAAVRDDLVAQGVPTDRITVLPNAVDPAEFQPTRDPLAVRAELGAEADTPVIGACGHLSVKKGYRELFAAIPQVLQRVPRAQFWILGQGELRGELEAAATAGGFANRVRLLGYRRDAADLINAFDVFCLPSHREPFGLVYVEAALLGKPVVGCRAGGACESIADGESGLLVPPFDADALAEALLTLLDDPAFAQHMGATGRERALDLFGWHQYEAALEAVYDRAAA
ncbi:MAG: glycosyltransferase family 4 protein [Planctomycetales bacterium]|nr:glycosyltransferase family 4 protein [Planctomycetales bacterium]